MIMRLVRGLFSIYYLLFRVRGENLSSHTVQENQSPGPKSSGPNLDPNRRALQEFGQKTEQSSKFVLGE
jgi:hypothetical protein